MNFINLISKDHLQRLKNKDGSKFLIIKDILSSIILENIDLQGTKMPSTRELSAKLSVSRSTVIRAYELLLFENLIESKKSTAYFVRHAKRKIQERISGISNYKYPELSSPAENFMLNVGLMNTTSDEEIAFRPGLPPLDIFPVDIWKKLTNQYWKNVNSASLSYSNASGLGQVRKNIAYYLKATRGIDVEEQQIIIVSGSLQSLFLVGTTVLNPGDGVIIENPTFPNIISLFKSLNADITAANLDKQGIAMKEFDKIKNPKLIHITPSNHYPTGIVMSLERRLQLLKYANEQGAIIIENDYDHEISNYKSRLPSLFELDTQQRTIFLGTFNRLLHPSIRMAYVVLPPYLTDAVKALQKHSHRSVAPSLQAVLSEFIQKDHIFRHIKNMVDTAVERKEIFMSLMKQHLPQIKPTESPAFGLHLLYKLPNDADDKEIVRKLKSIGILSHAYSNTFLKNQQNGLVFGYSAIRKHLMEDYFRKITHTGLLQLNKK